MSPYSTVQAISDFLFIPDNPKESDLMLVFGSTVMETMDSVNELYKKGYAKRILLSGYGRGVDRVESESEIFLRKGLELGIPREAFLIEDKATNTKENVLYSKAIIESFMGWDQIKTILCVCKSFHTRRVLMTLKQFFPEHVEYCFYSSFGGNNIRKNDWWKNEVSRKRIIGEIRRIGEYAEQGDLSIE